MKKTPLKFRKKIVFFCPSIEEGGVEKNLINITNLLSKNFQINLVTANKNKSKYFNKDIKFISPNNDFFNTKNRSLKILICLYLLITQCKSYTLIFSFQANITAIIIAKFLKKKIIIRSNSSPNFYAKNFIKRFFMKRLFKFADKVIVNSLDFKKEFIKYFNIKPIVIYNSIENEDYLLKNYNKKVNFNFFDNSNDSLKILSIGRLVDQKDHLIILKALNLIKFKKNFKFCLIGKGYLKDDITDYINANNLESQVKIVGYKENVYPYYKKADLFILSSKYEGLPNTLIEALTFGLNIISTDCKTGPKEILKNGKFGKLFKVGDYKKLSELILFSKKRNKSKIFKDFRFNQKTNILKYKKILQEIK